MPSPANFNAFLGASVLGIVCAATLYMVEHFRQERRRHGMAKDLARLDTELAVLRRELDELLARQKEKCSKPKRSKRSGKAESVISSSTVEDFASVADDSSDLEFYDLSDDDATDTGRDSAVLATTLHEIDAALENVEEAEACLAKLQLLTVEFPNNPHLLWRIGKAYYRLFQKTEDKTQVLQQLTNGIEICGSALNLPPELAEVHKWMAILIGARSEFLPMKEKILAGLMVKKHSDLAISIDPTDSAVHHILGRFHFEIAALKWYERKVVTALFSELPSSTYEEALQCFLEAEKLSKNDFKENKLYIAKCRYKLGDVEEAVRCLEEADRIKTGNGKDDPVDIEVKTLLDEYSSNS